MVLNTTKPLKIFTGVAYNVIEAFCVVDLHQRPRHHVASLFLCVGWLFIVFLGFQFVCFYNMASKPEFGYQSPMSNVLVYFYTKLEASVRISSLTIANFSPLPPKSSVKTNSFNVDFTCLKRYPRHNLFFLCSIQYLQKPFMKINTAPTNAPGTTWHLCFFVPVCFSLCF